MRCTSPRNLRPVPGLPGGGDGIHPTRKPSARLTGSLSLAQNLDLEKLEDFTQTLENPRFFSWERPVKKSGFLHPKNVTGFKTSSMLAGMQQR